LSDAVIVGAAVVPDFVLVPWHNVKIVLYRKHHVKTSFVL
jgi:hypothetical protein